MDIIFWTNVNIDNLLIFHADPNNINATRRITKFDYCLEFGARIVGMFINSECSLEKNSLELGLKLTKTTLSLYNFCSTSTPNSKRQLYDPLSSRLQSLMEKFLALSLILPRNIIALLFLRLNPSPSIIHDFNEAVVLLKLKFQYL